MFYVDMLVMLHWSLMLFIAQTVSVWPANRNLMGLFTLLENTDILNCVLSVRARNTVSGGEEKKKYVKRSLGHATGRQHVYSRKETGGWKAANLILVDVWLACFGDVVDTNDNWPVSDILLRT